MPAHAIEISDLTALDALEVRGSLTRPRRGQIILRLPALYAREQRDWQRRLTRNVFACGCGLGAGLGFGSLIVFAGWRIVSPAGISSLTWTDIPLAVLVFMAGTGTGKSLGLAAARVTLHRAKTRLHELVAARAADTED